MIYEYIKVKSSVTTFMQVKPQPILLEKHVEGLGFKLKDKGKKTCKILLHSKEKNLQQVLMLSYYSMSVSSISIPEGLCCLAFSNLEAGATSDLESIYTMM